MKRFWFTLAFILAAAQVFAADITVSTTSKASKVFGMSAYTAVLSMTSAADGSASFDMSSDGGGVLAKYFTPATPGTIMSIKVDLGEGANTPTTLFDVYLYDSDSTLQVDLLRATGANLAVTADTVLHLRDTDGDVIYQPLSAPPILTVANAGNAKTATFTVVILSDPIR